MKKCIPITDETRRVVRHLASLGLSYDDIAITVGVSRRTLQRRCSEDILAGRAAMRTRLHNIQWSLAEKSPTMAIFLGKQYLGQKDVPVPPDQKGTIIEYVQNVIVTTKQAEAQSPAVEDKTHAVPPALPPVNEQAGDQWNGS